MNLADTSLVVEPGSRRAYPCGARFVSTGPHTSNFHGMPAFDPIGSLPIIASVQIEHDEYQLLSALIYRHFGINLEGKQTLLASRLGPVLRRMGLATFHQYYEYVVGDATGQALNELVDYISTNHTFFYREKEHFEFFQHTILPQIVKRCNRKGARDLRVWSAGCSSGEEAYMLVMYMMECLQQEYPLWDAGVLGTDISSRALAEARRARYAARSMGDTPESFRLKYFKKRPDETWEIAEAVKREVTFRRFNLIGNTFPFQVPFDVIFCRNVMIYFDAATIDELIRKFHQFTAPGGYLFIGHTESLNRDQRLFQYVMPGVYRRA